MKPKWMLPVLWIVVLSLVVTACGGAPAAKAKDKVTLQLKWVTQSQFAGYYAAKEKGFYDAENLDVTIQPGGPDIVPEQVVAGGAAQFGIDWLPSLLSAREQGTPLVNIAQVFQYSGMREIFWKDSGLMGVPDFKGKKVAVWLGGNEFELLATLNKYKLDKDKDLTIVQQPFDMNLLLNRQVDAAAAMTYNEYAQVLESTNPKTGQLYKPEDLVVVDFNKEGTAMLEDGIFSTETFLKDANNQDIATRFLKASFRGWIYCRDNWKDCVEIVLKQGPTLGRGHMAWQMNEINKLIWPSPNGIGVMDAKLYQQTVAIAKNFGVIKQDPSPNAYTTQYAQAAVKTISEDAKGLNWQPATVEVTAGGK